MEKLSGHSKGLILAVISAICWGTYGTFISLLTRMGIGQMTLVALVPTLIMLYGFIKSMAKHQSLLKIKPIILVVMVIHGLVITNGINYGYVRAVETVPIAIVSIISFCNVIVVMIASRFLFGYSLTLHKIIAILSALLGICLIIRVFDSSGMLSVAGIGWALMLPLLSGCSSVLYRFYMNNNTDEDAIMFWINMFAAIFIWFRTSPWSMVMDAKQAFEAYPHPFAVVLGLAGFCLIPLVICYYTFFKAYKYVEPTYVSLCYALDPATAAVLGFVFFEQRLNGTQILGIVIVIAAILYIKLRENGKVDYAAEETETM